jgi:hypothetical protein
MMLREAVLYLTGFAQRGITSRGGPVLTEPRCCIRGSAFTAECQRTVAGLSAAL